MIWFYFAQIKIWEIPEGGLTSNLCEYKMELLGHKRKVLHIEWHPTASNILISAGFDHAVSIMIHRYCYAVLISWWNTSPHRIADSHYLFTCNRLCAQVILWDVSNDAPQMIKMITCHTDMIYSLAINRDGSLIATTSKDRKLRVIEPRSAIVISVSWCWLRISNNDWWMWFWLNGINWCKYFFFFLVGCCCRRAFATRAPNVQK